MAWSDVVRSMIAARGSSARGFAAAAGVSPSTVLGWTSEHKVPSAPDAMALLEAIQATPEERRAAAAALFGCEPSELADQVGLPSAEV